MCRRPPPPMLMTEKTKRAAASGPGAPQQKGETTMIDRNELDLRIADHDARTAQANRDGWRQPEARTHRAGRRGGRGLLGRVAGLATAATVGLGLLAGVVLGQAG